MVGYWISILSFQMWAPGSCFRAVSDRACGWRSCQDRRLTEDVRHVPRSRLSVAPSVLRGCDANGWQIRVRLPARRRAEVLPAGAHCVLPEPPAAPSVSSEHHCRKVQNRKRKLMTRFRFSYNGVIQTFKMAAPVGMAKRASPLAFQG